MAYNIEAFVGHLGLHNDEFTAGKLLRDRGQRKWGRKISRAKWEFTDDPNRYQGKDLIAKQRLPVGVCGWPYDEHSIPNAREKYICSARMVYDDLGIAADLSLDEPTRATYQSMVRYAMYADCKTGVDWQALPSLIKRRWSRYFAYQGTEAAKYERLEELVWRCERDIDEFFDETLVFWQALFGVKDRLEQRKIPVADQSITMAIIRQDNPATDNPQVRNAIMSRRWVATTDTPPPHLLFKRTSNGNIGIFMANGANLDLSEVTIALRLAELAKRGITHNLMREELLRERCELCPWIHWMEGSQTILNGSKDSARGVEPTVLEDGEIEAILTQKVQVQRVIKPRSLEGPDNLELPGPVKAALMNVPGPVEELILLAPGNDGLVPVATFND